MNPQCTDLILNGNETDIDCGGTCGPCTVGHRCNVGADCDNGYCVAGVCTPLPCFNGKQDMAETDVDCGGGTCRKCAGGRHCSADSDCFSGRCDDGTCFALRTASFAAGVAYPSGLKTYALFSGDFNHDGRVDLAAANEEDSSIAMFLGRGDGTFVSPSRTFGAGAYPTGGAVTDLNGDGIPDLVTANYHGNSVSVLLGVGDGTFGPAADYPTTDGAQTSNLAVGDLDGDGVPDVIAANPGTDSVSQFMGRPGGTLAPAQELPVSAKGYPRGRGIPFSVAIGDFDGDGKNDIAIAELTSLTMVVRRGNGDGTFGPEVAYAEGGVPAYIVIAADVNLDGHLDLVVANRGSDDVSVLLGRGDGTFLDPLVSTTGAGTGPYSIAVADFNADGVPDVITANFMSSTASVLLGVGDGRFDPPIDAGATGQTSYGVAVGDFDGDGHPDFAVCNAVSNNVVVKLNTSR